MATANLLLNIQQQGIDVFSDITRNLNVLTGNAIGELSELETASETSALAIRQIGDTLDQSFDGLGGSTVEITNEFNQLDKQVTRSLSNVSTAAMKTVAAVMNIDDGIAQSVTEIRQDIGQANTIFESLNTTVTSTVGRIGSTLQTIGTAAFAPLQQGVQRVSATVQTLSGSFSTVFQPLQKGVQTVTMAVSGLGSTVTRSLIGALTSTATIIGNQVNPVFGTLATFVGNNFTSITAFGGAIITVATTLIGLVTALNPVTATIVVLATGISAALIRFESLRKVVLNVIDSLVNFTTALSHPLELLSRLGGNVLDIDNLFDQFKGTLAGSDDVFSNASTSVMDLTDELNKTPAILKQVTDAFNNQLTSAVGGNFRQSLLQGAAALATTFIPQLTILRAAAGPIGDVIATRVVPALTTFVKSSAAARIALNALKFAALDIVIKALQQFGKVVKDSVTRALSDLTKAILNLINVPFTKFTTFLRQQLIEGLLLLERVLVTGVIIAFRDTVQVIDTVVIQNFARLFNVVARLANLFRGDAVESLVFLGNIAIQAGNAFRQLASNFLEFTRIGQAATGIFNTISGVIQQLFARLGGLFTIIQQFFGVNISVPFDLLQASLRDLSETAVNTARSIGDNLTEKVASARIEFDRAKQSVIDYYTPLDELEKRSNAAADAIGNTVDAANRAADAQDKAAEAEADSVGTSRNAAAERERIANETAERERERARRSASDIIGRAQARQRKN